MQEYLTLEEIQKCCLGVLKEFIGFCEEHKLKYYLIGGSALGAIRHAGFIPWDDDIDVGMPRADYEKFCSSYVDSSAFRLVTMERSDSYLNAFGKLCDSRTSFIEPASKNEVHGVFVDIFPLDYIFESRSKVRRAMLRKRLYLHSFVVNLDAERYASESLPWRAARRLMAHVYRGKNPARVAESIVADIASREPTLLMMNIWGAWGEREVVHADWFGDGEVVPFCDIECRVPADWDSYLTRIYGDYMTPPKNPGHSHGRALRELREEAGGECGV